MELETITQALAHPVQRQLILATAGAIVGIATSTYANVKKHLKKERNEVPLAICTVGSLLGIIVVGIDNAKAHNTYLENNMNSEAAFDFGSTFTGYAFGKILTDGIFYIN